MDQERIKYFKTQYLQYTVDEIEELVARMVASPDAFTAEARTACNLVLSEQGLSVNTVLMNRKELIQKDQLSAQKIQRKTSASSKKFTRILMRIQAYPLLLLSLYLGWQAVSGQEVDLRGIAVAVLLFVLGVWGAFIYQGDSWAGIRNH